VIVDTIELAAVKLLPLNRTRSPDCPLRARLKSPEIGPDSPPPDHLDILDPELMSYDLRGSPR
jgi:hypothetical protein